MQNQYTTQIDGEFTGYHEDAIFRLTNGQVWQQSKYKYNYYYAYRPRVCINEINGQHLMSVEGMSQSVEVKLISLITEGRIISDFKGYNSGERFKFQNGRIWIQIESKHKYHYAHMPNAVVVNGLNGTQLYVDGMEDSVRVRKE